MFVHTGMLTKQRNLIFDEGRACGDEKIMIPKLHRRSFVVVIVVVWHW